MPKTANIEDAPHHLKLLNDYGKTAITLSLALLSLSVAFAEKLLKPPIDLIEAVLLVALWVWLILALLAGLMIAVHVNRVAFDYMKALRIAYPDALQIVSMGTKIKVEDPGEKIEIKDPTKRCEIEKALSNSTKQAQSAYWWATVAFWMCVASSMSIAVLGFYTIIWRETHVDASSAIAASVKFVANTYKVKDAAQFKALMYEEKQKTYTVAIRNERAPNEEYEITVSAASGQVTKATKSP